MATTISVTKKTEARKAYSLFKNATIGQMMPLLSIAAKEYNIKLNTPHNIVIAARAFVDNSKINN
jgi:hypothetical protein